MSKTMIQVPMDTDLKEKATLAAKAMGFSSLQESIRIWLHQIVRETPMPVYQEKPVQLSAKNEKRYNKMVDDVKSGKVKTKSFTNTEDLMAYLNS